MVDVVFVADAFVYDIPQGGAELVNYEVVNFLKNNGLRVEEVYSFKLTPAYINNRKDSVFIIGSFLNTPSSALEALKDVAYYLYEHDHKYCINRNPAVYKDFIIPPNELVHQELFSGAKKVMCQSQFQANILGKNFPNLKNIVNMGGSLWSQDFLESVKKNINSPAARTEKAAILKSDNPIKGQQAAESFCQKNNIEYDLIQESTPLQLFKKLQEYTYYIYFPTTPETFSRVFMEAKLAGCKIITNKLIGAATENYTYNDPLVLLKEVISHKSQILEQILSWVKQHENKHKKIEPFKSSTPLVSIITSVYKGKDYIDQFLEEITQQTIFSSCELILIDCNKSEDNYDKLAIEKYMNQYSNIFYHRLEKDPGVYGAWNFAIKHSNGQYITNANLDDRRSYENIETCLREIESSPEIDLVYSPFLITNEPNVTFYTTRSRQLFETHEYDKRLMYKCLPGCMPLWRRSLHEKNGYFDESYSSAGDLEFWLRCVKNGSEFKRVPQILGVYFFNPVGLSTSQANHYKKTNEEKSILNEYRELFA